MSEGSYYLTRDVTLSGDGSQIKVTGTVDLCLNGHNITGTANYGIFRIGEGGVLNICDCSVGQTGKITEKESHNPIFIHSGGVCSLYSGTIASSITAVVISSNQNGSGPTYEGEKNTAGGTFNLYGGAVRSTAASGYQGIFAYEDLTNVNVNIYGGSVSSDNYGVTLRSGTVTLSGSPELEGGNADIHLEGAKIAGGSGLTGLFSVHMAVPGVFTGPGMSDYKGLFTSANSGYDVTAASDGALMLSNGFTVSFDPNGGAFTGAGPADQHVPNGGKVDDPGEPAKSGCTFAGWYDGDTLWDFDSEVTGSMTLTAKWITDPTVSVSGDTALTYGTGGTLYAAVTPDSGQNYAYQWACGGVEISGATGASYTIPTAASVGSYDYSCTVTASITGSSVTASASSGVTVAVSAKAYDSASFSISAIGDQAYTGEQITPVPVVKFGGIELANGTDYDLSCSGNVNVGTGTVKINFKGNYSGEAEVEFSIIKASQAAPAAGEGHAIDYAQETIRIEPGYEVFTSPGGGTQISSGSVTEHLGQTLYIRKAETGTHSASSWTEFEVAGRPAAPGSSVTVSGETVLGKGDGSAGVPEGMEYSTDGGQVWTPGPAALTGLEADAVVIVRKRATDSAPHGVEQAYTVPASSTTLSVSFNENGGSEVDDASGLAYGDTITAPATTRGGYTFAGWYDGDAEWDFADGITDDLTLTAKWTLDAPTVVLSADKDSAAYGEELTLTATASYAANVSYAYEWYKGSEKLDGTGSTLSLKNVADTGSYTVTVTATDADGLTAEKTSVAVSVSIGKADPVTTRPTASAIIYGQSLSDSTLTGGSAAEGTFSWKEGNVYPASGSRAYTVVFIPADDENYNSVEAQVTVSVAKKALTPSVSSVNDKTYDGSKDTAGTISLSGAVLGEEPSASGKFSFRDADAGTGKTVDVTVTLDGGWGGNYVLSTETLEASADIRPRTVGLTWDGYENLVYDGEPVGVTAAATGLVGSDTCTVTVQNGDQANAGTYTATADGLDNANYQLPAAGATQDYTIAPRPVVLSWDAGSLTYDGKQHDITATIENLVQGDVCGLTYEGNSKTDAGSYTAKVTALGNGNYTLTGGKNLSCDWSIQRSVISFNVSGSSHIYDGQAKTAAVTQGTGQEQLPEDCYAITYGGEASQVEAGTYDITVTILNPNYCFADGSSSAKVGELVISQRGVAIPEADAAAFTYNGAEQTYNIAASEFYTVSGNVQKDAGSYTVTVSLNDKDNHTWPDGTTDDLSYDFVIAPKPVTATWMGLRQVYGDGQTVSLLIDGLEAGDSADDAVITGAGTDAGSYELTAALKNYALGPGTATLIIQRKPVIITVTDNIVRPGGEPVILAPGLNESDYAVTYRDKNGNAVPEPSAQGSYTVWVELTSPNYSFSDGSTLAQVGSLTVTTGTPQLYALDFDGGGGSGSTASMRLAAGSTISLPECGYTMEGFGFVGWEYAGKIYKSGDSFTMPGRDVTFTASWRQASGSVSGTVNEAGRPIAGAVVSLWLGSSKLAETGTNAEGEYNFTGLLPGTYNLVVSCGEQNVTNLVEISGPAKLHSFTLPTGITNSRVEVLPGSPDIVVGGLDSAFERIDGEVYTPTDAAAVENGGKVELAFTAEAKEDSADLAAIKKIAGGSTLALSMDYSLSKTVTSGDSVQTTQLDQSSVLLTVILPLDTALQGKYAYSVYRIHNGQAQSLGTSANALGEYFRVSEDKSEIVMYLRCFSTYVVGYEDAPQFDLPIGTAPDIVESEHGSVTVFPNLPAAGTVVTITPRPDEGYAVDRVIVTGEDGSAVELIDNGDGSYSFKSPGGKLKIEVTFRKMSAAADCPRDESCPLSGFSDLDADAWYHDGIHYCLDEGLMAGTGSVIFAPDAATSRAMIVTILWRLQGCPEAAGAAAFTDVAPGAWYAGAVAWAVSEGIAEGYDDGSFRPDDAITREQLAAMLWRYAA